ncbi:substrate-binding domain-containing protein [Ethanoligenens harbinense]|uniref:substrate-binding domain-containing protein n=1 Tax=Ethanoligenens harbinense TaxID=253239 RepID=UPI000EA1D675|nr:substrate-binding domain-containing protein [Ethanoligenens harbinense]AYF41769.1 molybdate ABC transporter substrate-binding protein [Ethanoligenens harbinense]
MKKKAIIGVLFMVCLTFFAFTGCSSSSKTSSGSASTASKSNQSLFIYCGAGMKDPVAKMVAAFEKENGAAVEVTYGNAAQIISQITATKKGDLFIAGDQNDLSKIKDQYVSSVKPLVKHIPVLAVQSGNPQHITGLKDLTKTGVKVVLGDSSATPIGKLSDTALTSMGILNNVNVVARESTAPAISTAISLGQCDAGITWKENTNVKGVEVVKTSDLNNYIKTIPAASLNCSTNTDALKAFLKFLDSNEVHGIWKSSGYELAQ